MSGLVGVLRTGELLMSNVQARVEGTAASAQVAGDVEIGEGTRIWDLAQIRAGAALGRACVVGRGAYIDHGVVVGNCCKIQNGAQLFAPARLGDGVFVGPGAILTNDLYPRAVTPLGRLKGGGDWEAVGVTIEDGASVGAGAVVLGGVTIGRWALVGAGSVVTRNVPAHALMVGSPARRIGWVGRSGRPLAMEGPGVYVDSDTSARFIERLGSLEEAL